VAVIWRWNFTIGPSRVIGYHSSLIESWEFDSPLAAHSPVTNKHTFNKQARISNSFKTIIFHIIIGFFPLFYQLINLAVLDFSSSRNHFILFFSLWLWTCPGLYVCVCTTDQVIKADPYTRTSKCLRFDFEKMEEDDRPCYCWRIKNQIAEGISQIIKSITTT
jgi:hypothetical protein